MNNARKMDFIFCIIMMKYLQPKVTDTIKLCDRALHASLVEE